MTADSPTAGTETPRCHADRDGDCTWPRCPQQRDGEPVTTGRHCPLDVEHDDWNESDPEHVARRDAYLAAHPLPAAPTPVDTVERAREVLRAGGRPVLAEFITARHLSPTPPPVDPQPADTARDQLAGALEGMECLDMGEDEDRTSVADALLPTVRRLLAAARADELDAAAEALDDGDWHGQQYGTHPATALRDRAAAIRRDAR